MQKMLLASAACFMLLLEPALAQRQPEGPPPANGQTMTLATNNNAGPNRGRPGAGRPGGGQGNNAGNNRPGRPGDNANNRPGRPGDNANNRPGRPGDNANNRPGRPGGNANNRPGGPGNNWNNRPGRPGNNWNNNNNWRNNRAAWNRYRRSWTAQRRFRWTGPPWVRPAGFVYRRWTLGAFLPAMFFAQQFWINNWSAFSLDRPPPGTVWVRYGNDAILVDRFNGEVIQVVFGIFY